MGRARVLWSQTREARCEVSVALVKYIVPIDGEKPDLSKFIRAEMHDNDIVVYFQKKSPASNILDSDPVNKEYVVSFGS